MTAKWPISLSHDELAFLVEAGLIYRDADNFQAARDVFAGVKLLYPKHDFPEVFLGTVQFQQKKFADAEAHYRKALELNPRSAFAYAYLGEVCLFQKKKEEAGKHLKTAVTLDPLGEYGKLARRLLEMADRVKFR
ncbi:MAG: tetratricopeptide repeat protein [Candidatus Sulfotelmatobacter sp.]